MMAMMMMKHTLKVSPEVRSEKEEKTKRRNEKLTKFLDEEEAAAVV